MILITRPEEDGQALLRTLQERGLPTVHEPLLEISPLPRAFPQLLEHISRHPDATLIATSANAVRALSAALPEDERAGIDLLAIGYASFRAAQDKGFTSARCASNGDKGGDIPTLTQFIARNYAPGHDFIHISGSVTAGNLQQSLAGYDIHRAVIYEAAARQYMSDTLQGMIQRGEVDKAAFYSPRTVNIFADLMKKHRLQERAHDINAICFSRQIADIAAQTLEYLSISHPQHNTEAEMLALICA